MVRLRSKGDNSLPWYVLWSASKLSTKPRTLILCSLYCNLLLQTLPVDLSDEADSTATWQVSCLSNVHTRKCEFTNIKIAAPLVKRCKPKSYTRLTASMSNCIYIPKHFKPKLEGCTFWQITPSFPILGYGNWQATPALGHGTSPKFSFCKKDNQMSIQIIVPF